MRTDATLVNSVFVLQCFAAHRNFALEPLGRYVKPMVVLWLVLDLVDLVILLVHALQLVEVLHVT